jgi:hypothetical protein
MSEVNVARAYWYVLHWIAGREVRLGEQVQILREDGNGELLLEFW